jgi:hypothetical protein
MRKFNHRVYREKKELTENTEPQLTTHLYRFFKTQTTLFLTTNSTNYTNNFIVSVLVCGCVGEFFEQTHGLTDPQTNILKIRAIRVIRCYS